MTRWGRTSCWLSGIAPYAQAGAGAGREDGAPRKARYFGQCEIFLLKGKPGSFEALVYNTTPLR